MFLSSAKGFITCQDPAVLHVLLVVCSMLLVYTRLTNVAVRTVMFYIELKQNTTRFSHYHPVFGGKIKNIFIFNFPLMERPVIIIEFFLFIGLVRFPRQ